MSLNNEQSLNNPSLIDSQKNVRHVIKGEPTFEEDFFIILCVSFLITIFKLLLKIILIIHKWFLWASRIIACSQTPLVMSTNVWIQVTLQAKEAKLGTSPNVVPWTYCIKLNVIG